MTPEQIKQLYADAEQYPLTTRIAALLYLEGVTYEQAKQGEIPVWLRFCDIEGGKIAITPRLEELARQLVQPQSVWVVQYLDDDGKYGATARRTHEEAHAIGSRERCWKLDEVTL